MKDKKIIEKAYDLAEENGLNVTTDIIIHSNNKKNHISEIVKAFPEAKKSVIRSGRCKWVKLEIGKGLLINVFYPNKRVRYE